jgi:phage minor structural protein
LGFARPVILDGNGAWEAVLENAYDIIVTGEVNGADTLDFKLPYSDPKRASLDNEKQVQIAGDIYRVRTVTDEKGSDGSGILTAVYAEAVFYDLTFSAEKQPTEFNAALAAEPLAYALSDTGWSVGTVDVSTLRTWQCQEKNALAILRMTQQIHGGDLVFDSRNKLVSLLVFSGRDSGALFAYRKNLTGIKRVVDTRSLVTRLYAYGKDGMTFASINNGKEYVEDFTYSNEVRVSTLDLANFTNPYQMLEYANMRLADYAKPRVSYVLSAMDLSVLTGYEHEQWDLGDIVTVDDRDLDITIKTRVIRREYNLQEPWKTVLELSTKLRELGDSSSDALADQLGQSNLIGQEIKDMVPFNHLRNSRADDGFAYWQTSGFEVDAENGVTGTASFKAVGVSGATKSVSQTVTPANRRSYTISAQIGSDNLVKGANGQVGIELVFTYEDGTTETRFIDLY